MNMNALFSKLLAIIMVLTIVVSAFPMTAGAIPLENSPDAIGVSDDYVAESETTATTDNTVPLLTAMSAEAMSTLRPAFSEGNGEFLAPINPPAADSTPISNSAELDAIRNNLSGKYHLTANIDMTGVDWTPIGSIADAFSGVFDGQGYAIKNLRLTESNLVSIPESSSYFGGYIGGLFGFASDSRILNVGLENVSLNIATLTNNSGYTIGSLIGSLYSGSISNCYVSGILDITGGSGDGRLGIGGVVGHCGWGISLADSLYDDGDVKISDTYNEADISINGLFTSVTVGGIAQFMSTDTQNGSTMLNEVVGCHNTGDISIVSAGNANAFASGICGIEGEYFILLQHR